MGRGSDFSQFELGQIQALRSTGKSFQTIANQIGRSEHGVRQAFNQGTTYGENRHNSGQPAILSARDHRQIFNWATNDGQSIREIKNELPKKVSYGTIWNSLNNNENVEWAKRQMKPVLTPAHKEKRLEFARDHMQWSNKDWEKVVFSDEKKWNLDGPDGNNSYWHDLRKEPQIMSRRQQGITYANLTQLVNYYRSYLISYKGGGGLMTWGGFGTKCTTPLAFTSNRMDSREYQDVLKNNLLRKGSKLGGQGWIFQQDNAPIHRSNSTTAWLQDKNVRVMDWPARSPDLNPMENLWADMARRVYNHGIQFGTQYELRTALERE